MTVPVKALLAALVLVVLPAILSAPAEAGSRTTRCRSNLLGYDCQSGQTVTKCRRHLLGVECTTRRR